MDLHKTEEFLGDVVSYVRFKFDREEIKLELRDHILDAIDYYKDQGYELKEAEEKALEDMGDAKEIGIGLDRAHNFLLGWIWRISRIGVISLLIINIFIISSLILPSIFSTSGVKDIAKEDIVYQIDLDERVEIDNRVIEVTNVIYEKNGDMNIFYKNYEKGLFGGWSLGNLGLIKDDLGNEYFSGGGYSSGGIITRSRRTIKDFSKDAKMLIIDYDAYNRKYRIEIPLKTGEKYE